MLPSYIHEMLPVREVQFREPCSQSSLPRARGTRERAHTAPGGRTGFTGGGFKAQERGAPRPLLTCPGRTGDLPRPHAGGVRTGEAKGSLSPAPAPPEGTGRPDKEQGCSLQAAGRPVEWRRARGHQICFGGRSLGLQRKWTAGRGSRGWAGKVEARGALGLSDGGRSLSRGEATHQARADGEGTPELNALGRVTGVTTSAVSGTLLGSLLCDIRKAVSLRSWGAPLH